MRRSALIGLLLLLVSGVAQAAASVGHRHAHAKAPMPAFGLWRNSNAGAEPNDVSVRSEGAMTSGIAGH